MIVDVNAYLGPFAFRRLRDHTAPALLRRMDAGKIDRAVVSSAAAITYRNAQEGNEELAETIGPHGDRLTPFAVINPAYAGWEDDLKACHERLGMVGLRLYPRWHNYKLSDASCLDLIDAATARGMIVSIPFRVEDPRQRSWLVDVPDLGFPEVAALIAARPDARFILLNGLGYARSPLGRKDGGLPANYMVEFSRIDPLLSDEFAGLLDAIGPGRIAFGTGMPFHDPAPALLKLDVLDLPADRKALIAGGNAARWLASAGRARPDPKRTQ
ncbi:amidohydrolase family protein [Tundrisphaera sp. TA3]|uniref:amidohydrolase family protein n=1 Tax=Tundrisphaera sp. TA3 TaxID=3435775 RepID=UPI003EBB64A7